jgi:hypothetical protein
MERSSLLAGLVGAGCWLFWDLHDYLSRRGFKLCGFANVAHATDGDLLQANATYRQLNATS